MNIKEREEWGSGRCERATAFCSVCSRQVQLLRNELLPILLLLFLLLLSVLSVAAAAAAAAAAAFATLALG